jgi:hypothetical protein
MVKENFQERQRAITCKGLTDLRPRYFRVPLTSGNTKIFDGIGGADRSQGVAFLPPLP